MQAKWLTALYIFILVVLWGVSFSIYKVALLYSPPVLFAGIRTFLGGIILLCIALMQRRRPQVKQHFFIYLISALFNVFLFFGMQTLGLHYLPAGLFSVLVYLEPVLVGLFAWLWLSEQMSWFKIIGLLCGFLGVAAISARSLTSHLSVIGVILGILTAISWGIGTVYSKKAQKHVDMMWLLTCQFLIGGFLLMCAGSSMESWSNVDWTAMPFILSSLFGGFFGIACSWIIWFRLVNMGEATRIAAFTFFVPLISVLTSVLFLHETVNAWLIVGLILIVVGIYLTNKPKRAKPAATSPIQPQQTL